MTSDCRKTRKTFVVCLVDIIGLLAWCLGNIIVLLAWCLGNIIVLKNRF